MKLSVAILLLFCAPNCLAQQAAFTQARAVQVDSGTYIIEDIRSGCKNFYENTFFFPNPSVPAVGERQQAAITPANDPLITVHGNLTYNFQYRSYIDTPFVESDMMQHSVQARLNLKIKDRYPLTAYITSRRSNSPYFSNATDISLQFRQQEMLEDIKKKMRRDAEGILSERKLLLTPAQIYQREKDGILKDANSISLPAAKDAADKVINARKEEIAERYKKLYGYYKAKMDKLAALQEWSRHFSRTQEIIEEKEKKLRGNAGSLKDSLEDAGISAGRKFYEKKIAKPDSTMKGASEIAKDKKKEIDSLKNEVAKSEQELKHSRRR